MRPSGPREQSLLLLRQLCDLLVLYEADRVYRTLKMGIGSHQSAGKGEKVWLTPPAIIEALGPFDLDPCFGSPRPWDTASKHFGPDAAGGFGGLHEEWNGLVFCNPPYDTFVGDWLKACADHGHAVVLTFARTETEWFHKQIWQRATALLFLQGRLFFHRPDGQVAKSNAGGPSVLVAYGNQAASRIRNSGLLGKFIDLRVTR